MIVDVWFHCSAGKRRIHSLQKLTSGLPEASEPQASQERTTGAPGALLDIPQTRGGDVMRLNLTYFTGFKAPGSIGAFVAWPTSIEMKDQTRGVGVHRQSGSLMMKVALRIYRTKGHRSGQHTTPSPPQLQAATQSACCRRQQRPGGDRSKHDVARPFHGAERLGYVEGKIRPVRQTRIPSVPGPWEGCAGPVITACTRDRGQDGGGAKSSATVELADENRASTSTNGSEDMRGVEYGLYCPAEMLGQTDEREACAGGPSGLPESSSITSRHAVANVGVCAGFERGDSRCAGWTRSDETGVCAHTTIRGAPCRDPEQPVLGATDEIP
ncbi:predicted protein [Postia placenta Mad-698-R]|nr:predicted protein [Postia placenta Mad-698-R]